MRFPAIAPLLCLVALAGCGNGDDSAEIPVQTWESHFGAVRAVGIALDDAQAEIYVAADRIGFMHFDGGSWWYYLTENSAILSNTVRDVALDSQGTCWIATDRGVNLFNGSSFAAVTFESTGGGLPSNDVRCLYRDSSGLMWAGTSAGASRYTGSSWSVFTTASGLASNTVTCIGQEGAATGDMWFGHDGAGLSRLDSLGSFHLYGTSQGLSDGHVNGIAFDSTGTGWFATDDGLDSFNGAVFTQYKAGPTNLPHNLVRDVGVDPQDAVWAATASGLACLYQGSWTTFTTSDGLNSDDVLSCLAYSGQAVWAGSAAGINRINYAGWTGNRLNNASLSSNVVNCAFVDSQGSLWLGTEAGFSRLMEGYWTEWTASPGGLSDGRCRALLVDADGTVWIGTPAGLNRLSTGGWYIYNTTGSGIPSNVVNGIAADSAGGLWLATANGVSRFDRAGTFANHGAAQGLTGLSVNCIGVDSLDRVWAGTTEGLFRWDGASWISFGTADGLPSAVVVSVAFGQGTVFVATPIGAAEYDGSSWTAHTVASLALASDDARSVAVADNGDVHVATASGLAVRTGGSWYRMNAANSGLLHDDLRFAHSPAGCKEVFLGTNGSGAQVYRPVHVFE